MFWETIAILNGEMFGISIIKFSRDRYKIVNLNLKKKEGGRKGNCFGSTL